MTGGEEPTLRYHVGWPVTAVEVCRRARRGLPVYWPTDPKDVDQRIYVEFADRRGANSE